MVLLFEMLKILLLPVTTSSEFKFNPQIANGTIHGQELLLVGTSDTDKIKLDQANNLVLNGDCTLKNGSTLLLFWNQTDWAEISRNDL